MNMNEIARGLDRIASEGVPANTDLWPQLRAQVGVKQVRRVNPRRRAGALLAAAAVVLALALGAFTPAGTNAATGALSLFGLQPIGMSTSGPSCVGADGRVDPTYTPAGPGTFTIAGGSAAPGSAGTVAGQAMKVSCPEGYELTFASDGGETNGVLSFFGVTAIDSSSAAPSCVGAAGRVDPISTSVEPGAFTIAALVGVPLPAMPTEAAPAGAATPATQISCPAGYQLTIDDR